MAEGETTLEYTPTWVVAAYVKKKTHKNVFEALHKIKQGPPPSTDIKLIDIEYLKLHGHRYLYITAELVLGIIAVLLSVFQDRLGKICITEKQASHWLPCKKRGPLSKGDCSKGKVPLLTATAWQHLQLFIFVVATVHATFSILTILFARASIREWKHWEDSVANEYYTEEVRRRQSTHARLCIRVRGGNNPAFLSWLLAFFKQFFGSVTKADYKMVRLGFIDDHLCRGSKFNFYNYMIRVLEADFKRVVGISWYLWFYVVISLLLNIWGWHAYFWISIIPLIVSVGANFPTRIFGSKNSPFFFTASFSLQNKTNKRTTPEGCWPKALRCLSQFNRSVEKR
ncbi:hypothetical protein PRUPE_6G120600 [Prunus persica]|uniref:MLO-like protein n=1 Tax=Prunus persica TaxID=3760 RepID=A0A251NP39_PRUPE|nr:hypothetical protein PRUPE_6G120600 [Prunus persica]